MPIFDYVCANSHESEELRKVDERNDPIPCPKCGENMELQIGAPHFDTLRMGVDSGFPTFYKKWGDIQTRKNRGTMKDSNNNQIKSR